MLKLSDHRGVRVGNLTVSTALIALLLASPAYSERVVQPLPDDVTEVAAVPITATPVDESALYYYAQNNQHDRVDAEIRRLRALHPQWTPPSNLYHGGAYNRDQPLWDLLAAQEISAIHDEIARRTAEQPGWQPPLELMEALERIDRRRAMIEDHEAGRHHLVLTALDADPMLLDEQDVGLLWVAARSYAAEDQPELAYDLFDLALNASRSADEVRGTLYHARDTLEPNSVDQLVAATRHFVAVNPGFVEGEDVLAIFQLDLHRDTLARQLAVWRLNPERSHQIDRDAVAAIEQSWSVHGGSAGDYELIGWAAYALDQFPRALELFQQSLATPERQGEREVHDRAARYGAALSLRAMGDQESALNMLEPGGGPIATGLQAVSLARQNDTFIDDQAMALYTELVGQSLYGLEGSVALTPQRVAQHTDFVSTLESAEGAEALGWYAYRSEQLAPAAAWFEKSLAWRPSPSAAEGLVRSRWRLGERDDAQQLLASYQTQFTELAALELTVRPTQQPRSGSGSSRPVAPRGLAAASQAQRSGNPQRCLTLLQGAGQSADVQLIRGWCLLDLGRAHEAATAFANASSSTGPTGRDAGYGHALAMLRQGRTFDALDIARNTALSEEQRATIARSALADQANQAFNAGHYGDALAALDRRLRFAQEPRDLTLLRAWSYLRLHNDAEARRLFLLLDQQLSTRDTQRGLAAVTPENAAPSLFGYSR